MSTQRIAETGIAETGIAETGIAETGIAEPGIAKPIGFLLALALVFGVAGPAGASETSTESPSEIDLRGLWLDEVDGRTSLLRVVQYENAVASTIEQGPSDCMAVGDLYFEGMLSGRGFQGEIHVCSPDYCVEYFDMEPRRTTALVFTVNEDCQSLDGRWTREVIQCPIVVDHFLEHFDFKPRRVADCDRVQRELDFTEAVRDTFQGWQDRFDSGEWSMAAGTLADGTPTSWIVDKNQQPITLGGVSPVSDFNLLEAVAVAEAQESGLEGSKEAAFGGTITRIEAEGEGCFCKPECFVTCDDPGIAASCEAHENVHCQHDQAICETVRALQKARRLEEAAAAWNAHYSDFGALAAMEVEAYTKGMEALQSFLEPGKCY